MLFFYVGITGILIFFSALTFSGRFPKYFLGGISFVFNPLPSSDAVRKQKKNILEDLFSSVLPQFKKISPLWKPDIPLFRHFSKLKISYLIWKIHSISFKLNFTPNTLGRYGLRKMFKNFAEATSSPLTLILSWWVIICGFVPVAVHNAIPFVGFGFLDNAIMIIAVSIG